MYQKDRTEAIWDSYIKVRNTTTKKIRQAKKGTKRYSEQVEGQSYNVFWKMVRQKTKVNSAITELETNGSKISTDKGKAETLNRFFSSVFTIEDKSSIILVLNIIGKEQEPQEIIEDIWL